MSSDDNPRKKRKVHHKDTQQQPTIPKMPFPLPINWSLLKVDRKIEPYYYSMSYRDDFLGYEFYLTDFVNVWCETAHYDDVIKIGAARDFVLSGPQHVQELLGLLDNCLFQQYNTTDEKKQLYKSELILQKNNKHQDPCDDLYLTLVANGGDFKWDFNVERLSRSVGSNLLKYLNFSLFNISHRLDLQLNDLKSVIDGKDRVIENLKDIISKLHGDDDVLKYARRENVERSKALTKFDYGSWAKQWDVAKNEGQLNMYHNNIWSVINTVSMNRYLWQYSNHYYDSLVTDGTLPLAEENDENNGMVQQQEQPKDTTRAGSASADFVDSTSENNDGSFKKETVTGDYKKRRITTSLVMESANLDGKENMEHLSQSFSENFHVKNNDDDKFSRVVKSPASPRLKQMKQKNIDIPDINASKVPKLNSVATDIDESDDELLGPSPKRETTTNEPPFVSPLKEENSPSSQSNYGSQTGSQPMSKSQSQTSPSKKPGKHRMLNSRKRNRSAKGPKNPIKAPRRF
ncbi:hypothetical protein DASC09_048550 [Saccharomycopsis crataegensis]|uniref:XLF-like N-terminal domain-containing protein n=1 Tax=Saccharomycopsis crataegensis TaxID=43959 RepID=A0AAV5QSH0_9ASCO|nr:hypothetical protein DASC09_048550 [Saccharomycopsis crataegensis]